MHVLPKFPRSFLVEKDLGVEGKGGEGTDVLPFIYDILYVSVSFLFPSELFWWRGRNEDP